MYYRVAIQGATQPSWKWQSTVLSSLNSLLQWLQVYRAFPLERLRIFSSASSQELNAQLVRENQGLPSTSVPAPQFLQAQRITLRGVMRQACSRDVQADDRTASSLAKPSSSPDEHIKSLLDRRREEIEFGVGGDHDQPYQFTLPTSIPQLLSWMRLLARA